MADTNKSNQNDELKPLNPHKRLVKRVFREYSKEEPIAKPVKKQFYIDFPKKTKQTFEEIKIFIYQNKNIIILSILILLIIIFIIILLSKKMPSADFIDRLNGNYIKGYVYFDGNYTGSTSGENFNNLPKEYCNDTHIIRLESENGSYEWQTYPIDCKSKKIVFYIEHEKALPSKNIIFNFLDTTGSFYLSGRLYFDDNYIGYVTKEISITKEQCKTINKIKLQQGEEYSEWNNSISSCDSSREIQFKVT
jgi:hypothetical protein